MQGKIEVKKSKPEVNLADLSVGKGWVDDHGHVRVCIGCNHYLLFDANMGNVSLILKPSQWPPIESGKIKQFELIVREI